MPECPVIPELMVPQPSLVPLLLVWLVIYIAGFLLTAVIMGYMSARGWLVYEDDIEEWGLFVLAWPVLAVIGLLYLAFKILIISVAWITLTTRDFFLRKS